MRFAPVSFRPTFGRVLSVIVVVIAASGLVGSIISGTALRTGWGMLLLAAVALALFWFPRLDVAEHEVTVVNVFSTIHIPWPAIQRIDTKYALEIYTLGGKVTVWASPAPNRYSGQTTRTVDAKLAADAAGANPRPGDLLSTPSGAAAFVIRRHWEELRDAGHLENAVLEGGKLRRDIHWVTIAVLGALTVATVLGFLL